MGAAPGQMQRYSSQHQSMCAPDAHGAYNNNQTPTTMQSNCKTYGGFAPQMPAGEVQQNVAQRRKKHAGAGSGPKSQRQKRRSSSRKDSMRSKSRDFTQDVGTTCGGRKSLSPTTSMKSTIRKMRDFSIKSAPKGD